MNMTLMRSIANAIPPSLTKIPLAIVYYIKNGKMVKSQQKRVKRYLSELKKVGDLDSGEKKFLKTLSDYCLFMNRAGADKYLDSYIDNADFTNVRRNISVNTSPEDVILICCVKNDLLRIEELYKHHINIGIQNMVFVDNMSDDGTFEWLLKQNVDIWRTSEKYHAGAKSAWVRKVQEAYGFNRWYLIVDSDELFSYIDMERHSIKDFIMAAKDRGINRVRGFLLDMYTDGALFQVSGDPRDFVRDYRFFDSDSFYFENDCRGVMLRGGPRKRIFEANNDYAQPLTKYPLLYATIEDVWADHTPMPFEKNFRSDCYCALRHYKFLPEDKSKFYKIAQEGNYAKGSYEYKNYISRTEKEDDISFYYEDSKEFSSSNSLLAIPFMKSMF